MSKPTVFIVDDDAAVSGSDGSADPRDDAYVLVRAAPPSESCHEHEHKCGYDEQQQKQQQ